MADIRYGIDWDLMAQQAENEEYETEPSGPVYEGEAAQGAARQTLERYGGGRPNLGHSRAQGVGESPRRQVRLTADINARLDAYASEHGLSASQVIREALDAFL